jgi:MraZ protein
VEFTSYFHGFSLNAVDAKGRVSLPANFRSVVESRARPKVAPGEVPVWDRQVFIGEHEELECLVGYDSTYSQYLSEGLDARAAATGDDLLKAGEIFSVDAFGSALPASYDDAGRMVMPITRKLVGIEGLAFFVGAGRTFQIWAPETFRASGTGNPRLLRALDLMLAEKGGKE